MIAARALRAIPGSFEPIFALAMKNFPPPRNHTASRKGAPETGALPTSHPSGSRSGGTANGPRDSLGSVSVAMMRPSPPAGRT